jgi:hypothetical protein
MFDFIALTLEIRFKHVGRFISPMLRLRRHDVRADQRIHPSIDPRSRPENDSDISTKLQLGEPIRLKEAERRIEDDKARSRHPASLSAFLPKRAETEQVITDTRVTTASTSGSCFGLFQVQFGICFS